MCIIGSLLLSFHWLFFRNLKTGSGPRARCLFSSFPSVQVSVVDVCRLSSVVLLLHCFLFPLSVQHQLLLADASPHCFYSLSAYQRAGRDIPTPFLYSHCLQRTLVLRTLCTASCAKTKPTERKEGRWVRVVTQGVYTALFSLGTVLLFSFPNGVWTCEYTS